MEKIFWYIRRISLFAVTVIPTLVILYFLLFYWEGLKNVLPLPLFLQVNRVLLPVASIGLWVFFPALLIVVLSISQKQRNYQPLLLLTGFLIGIPLCLILSYSALCLPETIFNSAQLDNQNYYLTTGAAISDPWTIYRLYECNQNDLNCKTIYEDVSGAGIDSTNLIVDEYTKEVHFFRGAILYYSHGVYSHIYQLEDLGGIGADKYTLYSYEIDETRFFLITRCDESETSIVSCEVLPFRYSTTVVGEGELSVDEGNREINLLVDGNLVYKHGNTPQCYVDGCVILSK